MSCQKQILMGCRATTPTSGRRLLNFRALLILAMSALIAGCAATPVKERPEQIHLPVTGSYRGEAVIDGKRMKVALWGIDTEPLSRYADTRPMSIGNRIFFYFGSGEKGAPPYGVSIHSDVVIRREAWQRDFSDLKVTTIEHSIDGDILSFEIPLDSFDVAPRAAWTHHEWKELGGENLPTGSVSVNISDDDGNPVEEPGMITLRWNGGKVSPPGSMRAIRARVESSGYIFKSVPVGDWTLTTQGRRGFRSWSGLFCPFPVTKNEVSTVEITLERKGRGRVDCRDQMER